MPPEALQVYVEEFGPSFRTVLDRFDEAVSGGLPFSYCDVVANFYSRVFDISKDRDIRRLVLVRLLDMGVSHNRFHVQGVFCRLVECLEDPADLAMLRSVLQADAYSTRKMKGDLLSLHLPPMIRSTVESMEP
jgi:hypothetical protein